MDEDNSDSVFSLVTSLCEKFTDCPLDIKKSRSACYELLLGKRFPQFKKVFEDLKGTTDPYCNLLAWQFSLANDYQLRDYSNELKDAVEKAEICYSTKNTPSNYQNILQFLMSLRSIPSSEDNNKLDLSSLPVFDEECNFNEMFKLPESLICESVQFCDNSFYLKPKKSDIIIQAKKSNCTCQNSSSNISCRSAKLFDVNELFKDEGYYSPTKSPVDENIWEMASKLEYSTRKNWENYGHPEPDKEKPFLSELGDLTSLWVENLQSLYLVKLCQEGTVFRSQLKSKKVFIRDVKYLLVGMPSESFGFNEHGEFYLIPGVCIEGITPDTLNLYSNDLMFCGTCYKALNKISNTNSDTGKYNRHGYIFTELCESINRYLQFYRTAAMSMSDSLNLLALHNETKQIRAQIKTLASVCKVGPYSESEQIPHGVALLNYLYRQVLNLTDKNVLMVLYSILYPCCQVYFSRFLQQWILEGSINDPYGEFFIKPNFKYISTRGRTYWTRSYALREDILPDFLADLRMDILTCGKTMNLLKFCVQSSKLCLYLMGKKPPIISCCLTSDQLILLEQNTTTYYLEVSEECGPKVNLSEIISRDKEQDPIFMNLIAKKRSATLKRLELERRKILQEKEEKRQEELLMLKEQYDSALQLKQARIASEIEREINLLQEIDSVEKMRANLIRKESNILIEYYNNLIEVTEEKKIKIENHVKALKKVYTDQSVNDNSSADSKSDKFLSETEQSKISSSQESIGKTDSSNESFYSVEEPVFEETLQPIVEHDDETSPSITCTSLDIINANENETDTETLTDNSNNNKEVVQETNPNIQMAIDNFEMARKIKQKVMNEEMGIKISMNKKSETYLKPNTINLTAAQRNKLRVLSSEFGIDVKEEKLKDKLLTAAQINRNRVLGTHTCLYNPTEEVGKIDNDNFVNKNVNIKTTEKIELDNINNKSGVIKKSKSLSLDFDKFNMKNRNEIEKPIPMSVDSTPLSDLPQSTVTTPATSTFVSIERSQFESMPTTAETQATDEGFAFEKTKETSTVYIPDRKKSTRMNKTVLSKRVTPQEATGISTNCLKLFLRESVLIPLVTQTALVNNELLRYFINDLKYLKHLNSLRDYFFLQDGEFGRNITENLFERLYDANFPIELINCRTLQFLVFGALNISSKYQENSQYLSFKINNLPKCFDLGNPDVLDCLSLTYKVQWPLNILLPVDTIGKYDEVFKYLVKLNRISWVLKKIFLELKILAKETGNKEIYLMMSPQYRRLHQCRHVMLHFIQTLQNYIVGEVLQTNWEMFERSLSQVTNLDELYNAHTIYIKKILFMCLLNQKTAVLRNVIHKIFVVILKFYDYLRSRSWECKDGAYVHPNFKKLESIFQNFEEFVQYLFKVGKKVAKSGYQPHLIQLLDMLNINGYYSQ